MCLSVYPFVMLVPGTLFFGITPNPCLLHRAKEERNGDGIENVVEQAYVD